MNSSDGKDLRTEVPSYVASIDSVRSCVFRQNRIASLLDEMGFDVRRWKTLLVIAEHQGVTEKELSRLSGISSPCCSGHIIDMSAKSAMSDSASKYYPFVKRVGVIETKLEDNRFREYRVYLTETAISFFKHINNILDNKRIIESNINVSLSGENIWNLEGFPIVYIELQFKSPGFVKEFERYSETLSDFKMPVVCTVTNTNGDKIDLPLCIDQEEGLSVIHENFEGKKHITLGDTLEFDGDKLFRIFEARKVGIKSCANNI